jgi:hypothetical protein
MHLNWTKRLSGHRVATGTLADYWVQHVIEGDKAQYKATRVKRGGLTHQEDTLYLGYILDFAKWAAQADENGL